MKTRLRQAVCLLVISPALMAQTYEPKAKSTPAPARSSENAPSHVVLAAWYDLPIKSRARRRSAEEFTAAHNRLPLGTRVRVTHLMNGKSVVVRISDRGIRDRRIQLDLCKEAAAELEMIGQGLARVRMQVLPAVE